MKIENGFVIGTLWPGSRGKTVMIAVSAIQHITLDAGNSPPADRVHFREARVPHIDLMREPE